MTISGGNRHMIVPTNVLSEQYSEYANVTKKIAREIRDGNLVRIAHGLYETDRSADGRYLAGSIYGPSYLSFEYALAEYNLIPETVFSFTSATFHKRKTKHYVNEFGDFHYRDVPDAAYPWGYVLREDEGNFYQIATPEKALCDKLYTMSPVRSIKGIEYLLFVNLRIDKDDFWALSLNDILQLSPLYGSNNLNYLAKYIERKKR